MTGGPTTVHVCTAGRRGRCCRGRRRRGRLRVWARVRDRCGPAATRTPPRRAVERALEHQRERWHDGVGIGRRCRRRVVGAGERDLAPGSRRRSAAVGSPRRWSAARRCRARGSTSYVAGVGSGWPSGSVASTARTANACWPGVRPSGPASSRMLSGLTHSTNSTGLVVSRPHSIVSTRGREVVGAVELEQRLAVGSPERRR